MRVQRNLLYGSAAAAFCAAAVLFIVHSDERLAAGFRGASAAEKKEFDTKIGVLETQIAELQSELKKVTGENSAVALSVKEIAQRQDAIGKTGSALITSAVAKATPSVVSIVISKDVPQLQVVYENPFGTDPFFQNLGFQIPVYRQKGVAKEKVGAGSGFLITKDGYILTNRHVVDDANATYTVLLADGRELPAKVIYKDPGNDIAIVKIDGTGYTPVSFGDSGLLELGQTVIAIGNALGEYNNSVSVGIVSGLNRTIEASDNAGGTEKLSGVIQTDAAINPGNSGGPLVDTTGGVIGINVATVVGSNNVSFSIPINTVKSIVRAALGITV